MTRLTILAGLALCLFLPARALATVDVISGDEDANVTTLASFSSAKCQKATKKKAILKFIATAKDGGYTLRVDIFHIRSFARPLTLTYGSESPASVSVDGPAGDFSSLNTPPDAPPGGGMIVFNRTRSRIGVGFQPTFDQGISSSVDIAGAMKCVYPKKKRRR